MADAEPLDLAHLRRQTGGDAALEREVLTLFLAKATADLARIDGAASPRERREAAHALVGSARAVGALEVAGLAAAIENAGEGPSDVTAALKDALRAAEDFIRSYLRR